MPLYSLVAGGSSPAQELAEARRPLAPDSADRGAGDALGVPRPPALAPARSAGGAAGRSRTPTLVPGRDTGDATGRAPRWPFMRSVRLGEEEDVVEQLLCPEMTRWRWSSTRRRSCGSGRGTSGGCAAQNVASPARSSSSWPGRRAAARPHDYVA